MRSLTMSDMYGQRLAEFLVIEDSVTAIPTFALMHLTEADQSAPIASITPSRRWHMKGFLACLVSVAASFTDDDLCPTIESGPGAKLFHTARLSRKVTASALADVLGMERDEAREALRDHLTFPDA